MVLIYFINVLIYGGIVKCYYFDCVDGFEYFFVKRNFEIFSKDIVLVKMYIKGLYKGIIWI